MMRALSSKIQYLFSGLFAVVLVLVGIYGARMIGLHWALGLAISVTLFAALVFAFYGLSRLRARLKNAGTNRIIVAISAAVLIGICISAALTQNEALPTDLRSIDTSARILSGNWDADNIKILSEFVNVEGETVSVNLWEYFQTYPFNTNLLLILTCIYKLGMSPVWVNAFLLFASYVLTVLTAKKIYKSNADVILTAAAAALFPVFYGYVSVYYTDTFGMAFVILSVYLAVCAMKSGKVWLMALSAIAAACGNFFKNNVIILAIALVLFVIYRVKETGLKKALAYALVFVSIFAVLGAAFQFGVSKTGIYTPDSLNKYEIPKSHWIMMGLGGIGDYSQEDYLMTFNAGSYDEKVDMNTRVIKERLGGFNVLSFTKHIFYEKAARTWGDGAYLISYYHPKNAFFDNGVFIAFSLLINGLLVFGIAASFLRGARGGEDDFLLLPKLVICGVFLLYLIWETRSRYLVLFSPMYLLTFASGVTSFSAFKRPKAIETPSNERGT